MPSTAAADTQRQGDRGTTGITRPASRAFTTKSADVFVVTKFSGTNDPVPAKAMLKLVNR